MGSENNDYMAASLSPFSPLFWSEFAGWKDLPLTSVERSSLAGIAEITVPYLTEKKTVLAKAQEKVAPST